MAFGHDLYLMGPTTTDAGRESLTSGKLVQSHGGYLNTINIRNNWSNHKVKINTDRIMFLGNEWVSEWRTVK